MLEKEWFELLDTSNNSKHSWRAAVGFASALCSLRCRFLDQNKQTKVLSSYIMWKNDRMSLLANLQPTMSLFSPKMLYLPTQNRDVINGRSPRSQFWDLGGVFLFFYWCTTSKSYRFSTTTFLLKHWQPICKLKDVAMVLIFTLM